MNNNGQQADLAQRAHAALLEGATSLTNAPKRQGGLRDRLVSILGPHVEQAGLAERKKGHPVDINETSRTETMK